MSSYVIQLCGGAEDGREMTVPEALPELRVPVPPAISASWLTETESPPNAPIQFEYAIYRRTRARAHNGSLKYQLVAP